LAPQTQTKASDMNMLRYLCTMRAFHRLGDTSYVTGSR
jgi:hypothetical protein